MRGSESERANEWDQASRVEDARLIKVMPVENAGAADICWLVRDKVSFHAPTQQKALYF